MYCAFFNVRHFALLLSVLVVAVAACSDTAGPDTTLPGSIPALTATASGSTVSLDWSRPADKDLSRTLIVRFPTTGIDGKPETGRTYAAGDVIGTGRAVFVGVGTKATDLEPCKAQVYAAWARDEAGNWSAEPKTVALSGVAGPLPAAPLAMTAAIDKAAVKLAWTASGGAAPTYYRVVRTPTLAPTGPKDGVPIFLGSGTSVQDVTADFSTQFPWHYGVYACNPCGECESSGARAFVTPTTTARAAPPAGLLQALRAGGLIVYWRHTTADVCVDNQNLGPASAPQIQDWWKSCERDCTKAVARQLSSAGYADAEKIGRDVKAKGIPFASVTSSEYCRTFQTAERMALGPVIQTTKNITFFVYPEIDPCPAAEALFKKVPSAASNTALVGHLTVPCMSLDMGQAMVLKPDGKGGYTTIAKVQPSEWAGLI